MALRDFIQRTDQEGPFEIIDGEVTPMSPTVFGHSYVIRLLARLLEQHAGSNWEVFTETTFVRPGKTAAGQPDPDWVEGSLAPDVLLIDAAALAAYRASAADWRERPLPLVPALAVEVVSTNDRLSTLYRKAGLYLEYGVQMMWIVDPARRLINVFLPENQVKATLTARDTLTGGEVLPTLRVPVKDIFA